MVVVYILLGINILSTIVGLVALFRAFKRVHYKEPPELIPYLSPPGSAQFIEPISDKEKWDNAETVSDLLTKIKGT